LNNGNMAALSRTPRREQAERHAHAVGEQRDLRGEIGQVHRAGGGVHEPIPVRKSSEAEKVHDHVRRAVTDLRPLPAEGDEHVARRERDLEGDVEVEEVAGEEGECHARGEHQVGGVERRELVGATLTVA